MNNANKMRLQNYINATVQRSKFRATMLNTSSKVDRLKHFLEKIDNYALFNDLEMHDANDYLVDINLLRDPLDFLKNNAQHW